MNFLSLDIDDQTKDEWSGPCSLDYLEMRDGPDEFSTFLGRLCGSEGQGTFNTNEGDYYYAGMGGVTDVPDPIQSSQNHLRLR